MVTWQLFLAAFFMSIAFIDSLIEKYNKQNVGWNKHLITFVRMKRTTFSNKFKPDSAGRKLQDAIHTLEDDITEAEKAALTLDIGGTTVMLTDGEYYEDDHGTNQPSGAYNDATPPILLKIDMKGIVLKGLKLQIIKWKAQLVDKYAEYDKFLSQN
jgi:hypothetical protein